MQVKVERMDTSPDPTTHPLLEDTNQKNSPNHNHNNSNATTTTTTTTTTTCDIKPDPFPPAPLRADDHEAIKKKFFTEKSIPEDDFVVSSWHIDNWRSLPDRTHGPVFHAGTDQYPWRILLFPRGNNVDHVSMYLEMADPKGQQLEGSPYIIKDGWHACVEFVLVVSNPQDPTTLIAQHAQHRFTADEADWGFTRFVDQRKLTLPLDPPRCSRPLLEGDSTVLTCFVKVLKDETGVLWHNFENYDSKKETGYVGLKNQGATCYMNSLLQSLYCTPYFRRAVYAIPTEDDEDPSKSLALALQRVFYHLQMSNSAVGTTELTKSFGWDSLDAFMQHDVQEFNRVLQDNLEGKMKGTPADGAISRLFVGKMKSYIKCVNVDYESATREDYYDIQLNVKGCKTLADSFKDYIAVETLEGENKYQAEGHGLQDAKKGIVFESFPPVLHLQLKRFEYDVERDAQVKINDRLEFPMKIDLKEYLSDSADKSENWNYCLHGVLVHSGDLHAGHYFALLKPEVDSKWLKFDDDRVTPVTEREVLEDNYGGDPAIVNRPERLDKSVVANKTLKRFTNAYMLVYVRESSRDTILKPVTEHDMPAHLKQRLENERRKEEERRRQQEEQHLFSTVKVITDVGMRNHQGFDLTNFEDPRSQAGQPIPRLCITPEDAETEPVVKAETNLFQTHDGPLAFKVRKTATCKSLKEALSRELGIPNERTRLWHMINRQNRTVRPDAPVPESDMSKPLEHLREKFAKWPDWRFYLEVADKPLSDGKWFVAENVASPYITVFGKYYDPKTSRMEVLGRFLVNRMGKVGDISAPFCEKLGWPPNTPLRLFEEIKTTMIEPMNKKSGFTQSEIQDGDIICFQKDIPDKELQQYEFPTVPQFFEWISHRIFVHFKPKFPQQANVGSAESLAPKMPHLELALHRRMTYDQVAAKVAEQLGMDDPLKLRFTAAAPYQGVPPKPVKRTAAVSLQDMLQSGMYGTIGNSPTLYYEPLEVSIVELETKQMVKAVWLGTSVKEDGVYELLLPKTANLRTVSEALNAKIQAAAAAKLSAAAPPGATVQAPPPIGQIGLYEVANSKITREFSGSEPVTAISEYGTLYAEEIVPEKNPQEKTMTIHCIHYNREPARTHGVPFRFTLHGGEPFSDTKKRLFARLSPGISEKEFAKIRFTLVNGTSYNKTRPLVDGDVLMNHEFLSGECLGLDHPDKKRTTGMEKAIKIFN